jgi:hypothetical protein
MNLTLIKLFFELPIFQKNEVHVAKSFGNTNEALWQWVQPKSSIPIGANVKMCNPESLLLH